MPILFSLGARLEHLPLRDFHSNPTKIASALRQIRAVLKVDGLAAYFDPCLEAEALGCVREWHADGSCTLRCPSSASLDDLRAALNPPDGLLDKSPVRVARDVLQRAQAMLKDEPALVARVNGPFTLARQLLGLGAHADSSSPPDDLVEYAAEVAASVAKSFVEAGADVVLLAEDILPQMSQEHCAWWASLLDPLINVVRFYQAMPVLLFGTTSLSTETSGAILNRSWECVLCPAINDAESAQRFLLQSSGQNNMGLAVPSSIFCRDQANQDLGDPLSELMSSQKLVLLTSIGDIPSGTDMKHLTGSMNVVREAFANAS
jgi:Uroporphyrinogen decarboxylase (URO-D)